MARFCTKCGKELIDNEKNCQNCGAKVLKNAKVRNDIIAITVFIIIGIIGFGIYGYNLKLERDNLERERAVNNYLRVKSNSSNSSSNYTNSSKTTTSSSNTSVSKYDLQLSSITLDKSGKVNIKASGSITNNSKSTVKFVTVKISFKDSKGNTIDTESTYAVGSEGLAPRRKFKIHLLY